MWTFGNYDRESIMAFPRLLALPRTPIGVAFVALYVLLDWGSYVQPFGPYPITPWSPAAGLCFALILVFGERFLPLLFVAPLAAEFIVRQGPAPLSVELAMCAIIGSGYSLATVLLLKPRLGFQLSLPSMRDLLVLLGMAVVAAASVAVLLVLLLAANGLIGWSDVPRAALRYWVGDVIGVTIVAPFLLMLLTRGPLLRPSWESALQIAAVAGALVIVFLPPYGPRLQLFYLLFLPIVWIAVRTGLEGVTAGLALTQVGLMVAVYLTRSQEMDVTAFQTLMLILAVTGLATGLVVTDRRRAELQLRMQQEEHARIARVGSMGELATGIAHEINQPLMAAGTYTRLVARNLDPAAGDAEIARDAAAKAVAAVQRAAEVVRSLRTLVRLGRNETAPIAVTRIVSATIEIAKPMLVSGNITVHQTIPAGLPMVMVDALQVEQVLINILRNSTEAMSAASRPRGTITITATTGPGGFIEIGVRDTGPGFSRAQLENLGTPFKTTKADGLGIGLALSKTIVEAHGGQLWASPCENGAVVQFTLPIAEAKPS